MGLRQGDADHPPSSGFAAWLWPVAVLAIVAVLASAGDWGRDWLRYDRALIAEGQLWRLLSGHFVHLGWSHAVLNGVGLALICYLFLDRFTRAAWLAISLVSIVIIDAGFWVFEPQLRWYVGLSGVLHGYLAAGSISGMRDRQTEAWVIGALLVVKLAYEQLAGPMPGSEGASGGNVVVAAHLYGALAGALAGGFLSFRKARTTTI